MIETVACPRRSDTTFGWMPARRAKWRAGGRIDTDGFVLVAHPGAVAVAATDKTELLAHGKLRPARPAFSRKAPGPVGAAYNERCGARCLSEHSSGGGVPPGTAGVGLAGDTGTNTLRVMR